MTRRLVFDSSSQHKLHFRLLYEAFVTRGSAPSDKRVTSEEKRSDSKILRALKAISEPVGTEPEQGQVDGRFRTVKAEGGTLDLEAPDFKRLLHYVSETQWSAAMTDVAADLEDWIDSAEKLEATR